MKYMDYGLYGLYIKLYTLGMFLYTKAVGMGVWTCHMFILISKDAPENMFVL